MAAVVEEALAAGAVGFSTSRTIGHRAKSGRPVPGTFAPDEELLAIAAAFRAPRPTASSRRSSPARSAASSASAASATKPLEELPLLDAVVAGERPAR